MNMEFETTSGPVGVGRRRRWVAGLAATMLVAAAGGIGFGIGYAIGDDGGGRIDDAASATGEQPTTSVADEVAATVVPEPPVGAEPATTDAVTDETFVDVAADEASYESGWSESESGMWFDDPWAQLELVYSRTTEAGLTVRLQRGDPWPRSEEQWGPTDWVQPGWCAPTGQLRVTLSGLDVVDVNGASWYSELFEGRAVMLLTMGAADAATHRILVVQTAPEVDAVSVTFGDGATDSTPVVDGYATLVVPGLGFDPALHPNGDPWPYPEDNMYDVVFTTDGADVTVNRDRLATWDNADYRASCQPPPPALPAAGEQPADPAAAEAEIRAAMTELYSGDSRLDDNLLLLDDSSGVSEARAAVSESGYETEASSAVPIIEELVFTTPDEAWFRYRIETAGIDLDNRYGMAVVVDGSWRITRDTLCQDLSMAGGDCGDWQPVLLPAG